MKTREEALEFLKYILPRTEQNPGGEAVGIDKFAILVVGEEGESGEFFFFLWGLVLSLVFVRSEGVGVWMILSGRGRGEIGGERGEVGGKYKGWDRRGGECENGREGG